MRPFFFGRERRLYGSLHEARGSPKGTGVLLCYPGVQEYNVTHWAFRKLAGLLVRDGFHVLRFDYSCTGDSEGDVYDGRVDHWVEDISTAADELKDAAGVRKISVVGMRLGALLATRAVAEGLKVIDLVLWEPVFEGRDYVCEIERLDEDLGTRFQHRIAAPRIELAGYPFPTSFRASLLGLSMPRLVPSAAARVSMFLTADNPGAVSTRAAWERAGVKSSARVVHEEHGGVTAGAGDGDTAVLYREMLDAMASELSHPRPAVAA